MGTTRPEEEQELEEMVSTNAEAAVIAKESQDVRNDENAQVNSEHLDVVNYVATAVEAKYNDVPPPIANSPAIKNVLPTSAGYDEHPVCKGILMNCKITLANERVVFEPSSMPQDLPNSQIGYTLPLSSFYELAHRIFTEDFHHFFSATLSLCHCMSYGIISGVFQVVFSCQEER